MRQIYWAAYIFTVWLYKLLLHILAPFHKKARQMVQGRRNIIPTLRRYLQIAQGTTTPLIWIHVASMGEFEQARPIIEGIRAEKGDAYRICVTFFSPSGFEPRKDYPLADIITYIPWDGTKSTSNFLDLLKPDLIIFVKYEFWLYTLKEIRERDIKSYLISATFRKEQPFFRKNSRIGDLYREALTTFDHIFLQDRASATLLHKIGVNNTSVVGDTRIDRVITIKKNAKELPAIAQLTDFAHTKGKVVIVFGSSWKSDEDIYLPLLKEFPEIIPIIVPHEITQSHLQSFKTKTPYPIQLYSKWQGNPENISALVIDQIGLLSSIYRYGDIAYIGGGFGKGIHNTAEAAVYGIPIIFGPKYQKFTEAKKLLEAGAARSINNTGMLRVILNHWVRHPERRIADGKSAQATIQDMTGATFEILTHLTLLH